MSLGRTDSVGKPGGLFWSELEPRKVENIDQHSPILEHFDPMGVPSLYGRNGDENRS